MILDDHDEGVSQLPTEGAWLEPRRENLDRVVQAVAGPVASDILERLRIRVSERVGGAQRRLLTEEWVSAIGKLPSEVAQGIAVRFASSLLHADSDRFLPNEVYDKPQLVFDPGRTKGSQWNQGGLDKYGPYNFERFTPKRLRIAVVCQNARQGDVERFVQKILDGIRGSKYAENGLLRRYHLDHPFIRVFPCRSPSAKHYREAIARAIDDATTSDEKWDLALVQIDEAMHGLTGDDNPYLVSKVLFLAQQVPTQAFEWESIRPGASLGATLNNVGLACYAKVNGTPWLLPMHQSVAHELVVGLGSYETQVSGFGARERYIGVATVFSSDGRYMLESRTLATPAAEYLGALLQALERVTSEVRRQDAWRDDDPVRLVFHVFKDFNQTEIKAVKGLMQGLGLPHADYAFLHIAQDHPYLLFDPDQAGIGQSHKGESAAPRGLRVSLAREEALVCLKGPKELRQWTDGLPKPLLLKLHPDSTFKDLSTLARQVFDFSCLSWRSLLPSPLPITVLYADLIEDTAVAFGLEEGYETIEVPAPPPSGLRETPSWNLPRPIKERMPNGRLVLTIHNAPHSERLTCGDTKRQAIESRLGAFVLMLEATSVAIRAAEVEAARQAEENRRWQEERQKAEERRRREEALAKDADERLEAWLSSGRYRQLADAVEAMTPASDDGDLRSRWILWLRSYDARVEQEVVRKLPDPERGPEPSWRY